MLGDHVLGDLCFAAPGWRTQDLPKVPSLAPAPDPVAQPLHAFELVIVQVWEVKIGHGFLLKTPGDTYPNTYPNDKAPKQQAKEEWVYDVGLNDQHGNCHSVKEQEAGGSPDQGTLHGPHDEPTTSATAIVIMV